MVRTFERFTERARQVVVKAQDESRALNHTLIGTEHILLGLLSEEEGLAARVLVSLGITLERARAEVVRRVGYGDEPMVGQIPFTPRAKKILELSLRESLSLGHNYIGTEHVLLGLIRENDGIGCKVLRDFDVDAEMVRDEVVRMLQGPGGHAPARHQYLAIIEIDEIAEVDVEIERLTEVIRTAVNVVREARKAKVRVIHVDPSTKLALGGRHSQ